MGNSGSKIQLLHVQFLPKDLEPGILYVSQEYGVAGHQCPCGCGNKIITPLDPTEWAYSEKNGKPTLYPSIGNWQLPCRSHYWITKGKIEWSYQWTDEQIATGRVAEEERRKHYYNKTSRKKKKQPFGGRIFNWLFKK